MSSSNKQETPVKSLMKMSTRHQQQFAVRNYTFPASKGHYIDFKNTKIDELYQSYFKLDISNVMSHNQRYFFLMIAMYRAFSGSSST